MQIQLAPTFVQEASAGAQTPEEFAQQFMGAVTKGLAQVIADALDQTVAEVRVSTAAAAAITGWEQYVGGAAMQIAWERPKLGLPVGQVVGFAIRTPPPGVVAIAGVSWGVSISGSF